MATEGTVPANSLRLPVVLDTTDELLDQIENKLFFGTTVSDGSAEGQNKIDSSVKRVVGHNSRLSYINDILEQL